MINTKFHFPHTLSHHLLLKSVIYDIELCILEYIINERPIDQPACASDTHQFIFKRIFSLVSMDSHF